MKMRFFVLFMIFSILLFLFTNSCGEKKKGIFKIGIIQITEDPILDLARMGVLRALEDSGFVDGKNIIIDYKNAQGDISNINMILQSFKSSDVDLIITNSTPCMTAAATIIKDIPVVFTVTFSPEMVGMKETPKNMTGAYDTFRADEIINLIKQVIPNLKTIGLPFNPSEPNAQLASHKVREECSKRGIEVKALMVNSSNDILQVTETLIQSKVDAIIVAADNTVYLGLATISKLAKGKKIPVFVTDPAQAEKGAVIGLGADFNVWGYESGKIAVKIIKGEKAENIPQTILGPYQLIVNKKSANELGLSIPETILNRADKIIR
jgi:putative ABC transport system substrate-binding protein